MTRNRARNEIRPERRFAEVHGADPDNDGEYHGPVRPDRLHRLLPPRRPPELFPLLLEVRETLR